jgi:hypothetical protein
MLHPRRGTSFCRDLNDSDKIGEKTNRYIPLIAAFRTHKGKVEFVAISVRLTGATSTKILKSLSSALSDVRPQVETSRARRGIIYPTTDANSKAYDTVLFRSLLESLTNPRNAAFLV